MVPRRRGLVFIELAADRRSHGSATLRARLHRPQIGRVDTPRLSRAHTASNALMVLCRRGLVSIALKSADSMYPDSYELILPAHYQGRLICLSAALMVPCRRCLAASSSLPSTASQLYTASDALIVPRRRCLVVARCSQILTGPYTSWFRALAASPPTKCAQVFAVADAVLNVWIRPHDTNLWEGFVGSLRSTSGLQRLDRPAYAPQQALPPCDLCSLLSFLIVLVAALLPTLLVSPPAFLVPAFLVQLLLLLLLLAALLFLFSRHFWRDVTPTRQYHQPTAVAIGQTGVVKFGHTAHPTKRPRQWARQCKGQHQHWQYRWEVPFAAKFESLIHEHFKRAGAWLGPSKCEFCPVSHLETYDYRRCGGRDAMFEVVETYLRRLRWAIVRYDMSA
ncbi:hypothetical protein B0H17DRAFT_1203132 [Mycena rosella]|uniref:Bacteriophage T5 Orf172 DNA-binding domain-containing protein n=1 Tax=Mycena rosella TaxID=1033263 RepID=A0AAD7GGM1_MYCRO|nr:hypothetical protein B0H17DRAFT_1203132 [Mycena rosella]